MPLAIVVLFSFGERGDTGGYAGGFTFTNYEGAFRNASPFVTSLYLSVAGTLLCLLVGLTLAYFIATRAGKRKTLLIILLVIPFWTSFLIRTYSWLILLGPDLGLAGWIQQLTGNDSFRILGTPVAGRILFAGEHTQSARVGYADGAMTSGIREAKRLLGAPAVTLGRTTSAG